MASFAKSVCDVGELSSNGSDGHIVGFSSSSKAISETFENLIMMAGDESSLKHHMP